MMLFWKRFLFMGKKMTLKDFYSFDGGIVEPKEGPF